MKTVNLLRNGTYNAVEIESMDYELVNTISDAKAIRVLECYKVWNGSKYESITDQTFFVVEDGVAYPFSPPFYEADEDEGIENQEFPETWEDVVFLMECFGK